MANILHICCDEFDAYPRRLSTFLEERTEHESAYISGKDVREMTRDDICDKLMSADIVHYHGSDAVSFLPMLNIDVPKNAREVLQVYGGRCEPEVVPAWIPVIITPCCYLHKWPHALYMAPEVPFEYYRNPNIELSRKRGIPHVLTELYGKHLSDAYAFRYVHEPLLKMAKSRKILLTHNSRSHPRWNEIKAAFDIGVCDIFRGRYNLGTLDFASSGVVSFCRCNPDIRRNIKNMTGALGIPWAPANKDTLLINMADMIRDEKWISEGFRVKEWMDKYWGTDFIKDKYNEIYNNL